MLNSRSRSGASPHGAAQGQNRGADIALNEINKLYAIERDLKEFDDEHRHEGQQK